jgi:hypothetical protein
MVRVRGGRANAAQRDTPGGGGGGSSSRLRAALLSHVGWVRAVVCCALVVCAVWALGSVLRGRGLLRRSPPASEWWVDHPLVVHCPTICTSDGHSSHNAHNVHNERVWAEASDAYLRAESALPEHEKHARAQFLACRANCLGALGRHELALQTASAATALDPSHWDGWRQRGNALAQLAQDTQQPGATKLELPTSASQRALEWLEEAERMFATALAIETDITGRQALAIDELIGKVSSTVLGHRARSGPGMATNAPPRLTPCVSVVYAPRLD